MSRPKLLIEQWLPIETIGAECMRDASAAKKPPLNRLHVWWARRPLTVSRAAILASLLPAYPTEDDPDARPFPDRFLGLFPHFDAYKAWFLRLIGIHGDPVAGKKILAMARTTGKMVPNPYTYPRAFTYNPSEEQLEQLYDLLEWTWGTREITFCDPMSGGGSIPFEALRYGLTVHANELNPVASVILKATLDYPARFGPSLVEDIRKYGKIWAERVQERLKPYFSDIDEDAIGACYLWARTVACPETGKLVPLSPNWWLRKGADPIAVKVIADPSEDRCRFEIVRGAAACKKANPDKGTVKRGTGLSPWTGNTIEGDYIKSEAQAGRMGQQLYAVGIKKPGNFSFRPPTDEDQKAIERAEKELRRNWAAWEAKGLIPTERYPTPSTDMRPVLYGMPTWADFFSPRQLLSHIVVLEELQKVEVQLLENPLKDRVAAISTYLALAIDKGTDRNSLMSRWIPQRSILANTFDRHDFSVKWSFGEFDAAHNMLPWAMEQVYDSYSGLATLSFAQAMLPGSGGSQARGGVSIRQGTAQDMPSITSESVNLICVDPPYYDNVQYAECSDFFFVWMKRSLASTCPDLFKNLNETLKDEEAVANPARFSAVSSTKKRALAEADYENKMQSCFLEMNRCLKDDGVLTVMFTHKRLEAWDTLGTALISAGFKIDSSWPIHTEFEASLHQAKKNAAASTILLACRKREASTESAWWDDLKGKVRETARETAKRFEAEGIRGVDLYISTFGPVLSIISERWPVLTSNTDPKSGEPIPLQPGEALDLARREVINLRKQGLLLGRSVEFDPVTDWYLMAWDAFRAQEFPADEARKLALALGLDLEAHLIRDKRLVTKKGKNVTLALPTARRKKGVVDPDAESFPHLIDALHTAMMVYEEDGSKACQVFMDRHGLRNDSRIKALAQAAMQAIPTTRGKDGKFVRPEMTTLDALRLIFWEDLPAPPEEVVPVIERTAKFPSMADQEEVLDEDDLDDEETDEEDDSEDE